MSSSDPPANDEIGKHAEGKETAETETELKKEEEKDEGKNTLDVVDSETAPAVSLETTTPADSTASLPPQPPPQEEESKEKEPLDEKVILQARRKIALEALRDAEDLSSIVTLLALVKELHTDVELHPTAADLVNKATIASEFLMYKTVMERLTRPRSFGGLAWAESKAKQIADRLFETIGAACCATDISENKLVKKGGQDKTDARRILPHLIAVGEEIDERQTEIRNGVMEAPDEELEKAAAEIAKEAIHKVVAKRAPKTAPATAATPPKSPRGKKRKPEIPLSEDLGDGKRSMRARKKVDYAPLMRS